MSYYFFDTSAFAKKYISEVGTVWTRQQMARHSSNSIIISELGMVEFVSILNRLKQNNRVDVNHVPLVQSLFETHCRTQYRVIKTNAQVYSVAKTLLGNHVLRTLDAIQLASAIVGQQVVGTPVIFVTADTRLETAAQGEGFQTDNPLNYP